jgi:hypothetical protein
MKLRGFMFANEYVACGDPLTLVLGQNDAGKSRLLRKVLRVLAPRPDDRWADPGLPVVFVELSEDEKRRIFDGVNSANERLDVVDGEFGTNFAPVPQAGNVWMYTDVWDWVPLAIEWIRAACAESLDKSLETILTLLRESSTFALVPESSTWIFDEPPVRSFSVHWCIERSNWEDLARQPDIQAALERSDNGFVLLAPEATHARFNTEPQHQWSPDRPDLEMASDPTRTLPKPIVELGAINSLSHVLPITVPVDTGQLEHVVEKAVERVSSAWGLVYDPDGSLPYTTARSPWLEKLEDHSEIVREPVRVSPKVVEAVEALNREINLQLPAFVSRKYEARLGIRPIYEWDAKGRIVIELRGVEGSPKISSYDPERDSYDVTDKFPHSDLADGYRLWFQLAVLRGVRIACSSASAGRQGPIPKFLGIDLYLLDEPERHLHAGLQREAAKWLRNLLESDAEQALVVSHSPAFISELAEDDKLIFLRSGMATPRNISRGELDAAQAPARELGLTRGELLTLVRCLLVVEGLTDQAVLETLFGDQLRRAGVQVVPIHGHYRTSTAVIDIGSLLLHFTDAAIAVWLDAVPQDFVGKLTENPDSAGELRLNAPTQEAASIASLVELAPHHAIRVEPLANPASDILFLLDEDSIRKVFPEYPGHQRAEIIKADKSSKERGSEWFRRLLGKEKAPGAYVDIANEMTRSSTAPAPALHDVVRRSTGLAGSLDEELEWLQSD